MVSGKVLILVIVVGLLIFVHQSDAWGRRRRRRCPVQNCQVSSWSSWSACSASECGQQGSQSRSRQQESSASCGGAPCPDLHETRHCYGNTPRDCQVSAWSPWSSCSAAQCGQQGSQSKSRTQISSSACGGAQCPNLHETRLCYGNKLVDCQLSSWSQWSACTTPCGVSGTQHSDRQRTVTEQCGGTCTSTFRKTRACPELSCLNGGSLKDGICFCKEGYSGHCCEKERGEWFIRNVWHATPEDLSVQRNIDNANKGAWMDCMAVFLILAWFFYCPKVCCFSICFNGGLALVHNAGWYSCIDLRWGPEWETPRQTYSKSGSS